MPVFAEKKTPLDVLKRVVFGNNPRRTLTRLVILLMLGALAFGLFNYILLPIRITGPSMNPTYREGQINFINRLSYLHSEPARGDIVGIRMAGTHMMYYKRIIGLPGETVEFKDGHVLINGTTLEEPYLQFSSSGWQSMPKKLGPEEYYFVGDNRAMPFEDHEKGAAQRSRIIGKILFGSGS